ncbi:MAG: Arginine-tRNA-protein transferase [Labilithrix sp.]|nr:Arginine-tRNA-protein transferase [Labilithrix sp.]
MSDDEEVARVLHHLVEPPRPCSYLDDRDAQLEIRVMDDVTVQELDALLSRGWRRFGPVYFRPACQSCGECVTLRIDVGSFAPSKSQRRAAKNAARLRRVVGAPIVDDERLALYHRWHAQREATRGWDPSEIDPERYATDFAFPHPAAREVAFRDPDDGDRLVGLGIFDETERAMSAVYFFWDPERAPASLGVANVVTLVAEAREKALPHVYLGYRVLGCASLVYKAKYLPHELLVGRPALGEPPEWKRQAR